MEHIEMDCEQGTGDTELVRIKEDISESVDSSLELDSKPQLPDFKEVYWKLSVEDKEDIAKIICYVMDTMQVIDMDREMFLQVEPQMRAMVFPLEEMEYYEGVKLRWGVLEKLRINKNIRGVQEKFDKVYEISMRKQSKEKEKNR